MQNRNSKADNGTSASLVQNGVLAEAVPVKPILFSGEMVRAILEGRKTQTRRIVKFPNDFTGNIYNNYPFGIKYSSNDFEGCVKRLNSKWEIDDTLWVRETCQYSDSSVNFNPGWVYRATDPDWETMEGWKWKPSIFMPKRACRIFLKITDIRVERLQDINTDALKAEGINYTMDYGPILFENFKELWQRINGQENWKTNPFVWVIKFERCERPPGFW